LTYLCRERKDYSKKITTTQQANNPNNEVPPQDAQLQGVVFNGIQHNYKPKQEVPPQDAQLQGVIKDRCKIK
jgi:hypothetical protein